MYMAVAILYAGQNEASKSTTERCYHKQTIMKTYQIIPRPGTARPRAWAGPAAWYRFAQISF